MTITEWIVTHTHHNDCEGCLALQPQAEVLASVTGSRGTTLTEDRVSYDYRGRTVTTDHSITIRRAD